MKINRNKDLQSQKFNIIIFTVIWTIIVCVSLLWNRYVQDTETVDLAKIEARSIIFKDIIFRRWISMKGGVYAPVSEHTEPNPYLEVNERDIVIPSGQVIYPYQSRIHDTPGT